MEATTYEIPADNLAKLQAGFDKLGRRAAKLGLAAPRLVVTETIDRPFLRVLKTGDVVAFREDFNPKHYAKIFQRFAVCRCDGDAPVIGGWSLVSVIEHTTDPEIGNLIRNVPGMETPVAYRQADCLCQHCGTIRRRQETFLLLKDGEYKQVGRNCLADFCRDPVAAEGMISWATYCSSADGLLREAEEWGGNGGCHYYEIEHVLQLTACLIRTFGWLSRKAARERGELELRSIPATADLVAKVCFDVQWRKDLKLVEAVDSMDASDSAAAAAALEWIRSKKGEAETLGDYIYNLLVVCNGDQIPSKHFGLACSLISAYARELESDAERAARDARAGQDAIVSQHFGTIGKREVFTLTVRACQQFDSDYGVKTLCRFADAAGNVAIWWASGSRQFTVGGQYRGKATVKQHGEYKGTKQTVLQRCDFEEVA
jgi:hypothetical protein